MIKIDAGILKIINDSKIEGNKLYLPGTLDRTRLLWIRR